MHYFSATFNWLAGQGGGVIQGTASEAVLVVLLAARDKILRAVGKELIGKLVVYASDQTHSALQKACQVKLYFHTSSWGIVSFILFDHC